MTQLHSYSFFAYSKKGKRPQGAWQSPILSYILIEVTLLLSYAFLFKKWSLLWFCTEVVIGERGNLTAARRSFNESFHY